MEIFNLFYASIFIAITTFVWIYCLVKSGEILSPIATRYWTIFGTGSKAATIGKVLFQCEKCLAGQIALWYYLVSCNSYSIQHHFFIIIMSIFFAAFIGAAYKSLR